MGKTKESIIIDTSEKEIVDDDFGVVFYNDDVTPFVYVVMLLRSIFRYPSEKAKEMALSIHNNGEGVVFVSNMKAAYEKLKQVDDTNDLCDELLQAEVRRM